MDIEEFVNKSVGEWRSMRSGHSLAFQQFEDVLSSIVIKKLPNTDQLLNDTLDKFKINSNCNLNSAFQMEWEAESDWEPESQDKVSSGSCILIPIPTNNKSGKLIRSMGYSEKVPTESQYNFLEDGTFVLSTKYDQSIAEERIWFVSENVRCRSSLIKTSAGSGILQTSFASEVRRIKI